MDQNGVLCPLTADRGAAILYQKPLTASNDDSEAVVRYVDDRARLVVLENSRFLSSYRQIKT